GNAVRDYTKWDDQPSTVADFPASFARAYRIATTEPCGPVYLCYDAGLQEEKLARPIDVADVAEGARPSPVQADPSAIARLAELRQSKWSEDLGQFQPVALSIVADTSLAIPALRVAVRDRGARDRSARCAELRRKHDEIRARWESDAREDWDASPLTAPRLASEIWSVIKGEDWILTSNTLEDWALRLWDIDGPRRHPGRSFG